MGTEKNKSVPDDLINEMGESLEARERMSFRKIVWMPCGGKPEIAGIHVINDGD